MSGQVNERMSSQDIFYVNVLWQYKCVIDGGLFFAYKGHRQTPANDRKTTRKVFNYPICKILAIFLYGLLHTNFYEV